MPVNSASWAAYCVVKDAGMCCTRKTAAGNSRVNPGARRITVAGPPVEAPRTTIGNRCSRDANATDAGRARTADDDFGLEAGEDCAGVALCKVDASREAVRTTRTFADIRNLRNRSSRTLCMSRSTPLDGLETKSIAPSSSAFSVLSAPSRDSELTITIGRGLVVIICAVAEVHQRGAC